MAIWRTKPAFLRHLEPVDVYTTAGAASVEHYAVISIGVFGHDRPARIHGLEPCAVTTSSVICNGTSNLRQYNAVN